MRVRLHPRHIRLSRWFTAIEHFCAQVIDKCTQLHWIRTFLLTSGKWKSGLSLGWPSTSMPSLIPIDPAALEEEILPTHEKLGVLLFSPCRTFSTIVRSLFVSAAPPKFYSNLQYFFRRDSLNVPLLIYPPKERQIEKDEAPKSFQLYYVCTHVRKAWYMISTYVR